MERFCSACGNRITHDDARFCSKCGAVLKPDVILFGEQWFSASASPVSLTPSIPNKAPTTIKGKETIKWIIGIGRPTIEMTGFENMGTTSVGCGRIRSPIQNMNSDEESVA
jgi:hypothetical protein